MDRLRVDKWLWAARFYKTRTLAAEDVGRGRVQVNGVLAKPARELKAGDELELRIGAVSRTVVVLALSDRRGPATVAALLYRETEASVQKRLHLAEQARLAPEPAWSLTQGRPTKRDRRQSEEWRSDPWGSRWSAAIE